MDGSFSRRERASAAFDEADDASDESGREDEFAVFDAIAADIASEVDLVDELERILRGEAGYDDADGAEESAGAPVLRFRPAEPYGPVAETPTHTVIPPAVDLDALDEGEVEPHEVPEGFWQAQPVRRAEAPLRERRAPRTDLIVMASLAVVVLGLGAFAALGGWGGADPVAGIEAAEGAEAVAADDAITDGSADVAALTPVAGDAAGLGGEAPPPAGAQAEEPVVDPDYAAPPLDPADLLNAVSGESEIAVSASPDSLALVEPKEEDRVPESEVVAVAPATPAAAVPDPGIGGPLELLPEAAEPAAQIEPEATPQPVAAVADAAPEAAPPAAGVAQGVSDSATVASSVNMRGGPDNGAPVLLVVPAGSTVDVVACAYWCEVVFNGQSGWIYRDFLRMQ